MAAVVGWCGIAVHVATGAGQAAEPRRPLVLEATESLAKNSPMSGASYLASTGLAMIGPSGRSDDNGRTWSAVKATPDFDGGLPHGYRREWFPPLVDPVNGHVVRIVPSLDTPGLDPSIIEPPVAQEAYYLRYRVSIDGGRTFLFDEPVVQRGRTPEEPFDGVIRGRNGIYMGDIGSTLIRTREGRILVPAQACKLGPDGKLWSPGGGFTYTDVIVLIGTWQDDHRISWEISRPIEADPARSTRGMIEPTIAEFPDGRLLCVMRGSNGGSKDPEYRLPSHKWASISEDGGRTWTTPEPWQYDDGSDFFSPSSMSQLIRHSSGRVFWVGNISPTNCRGNHPRHPLVIGEIDPTTLRLVRDSVLEIDTKRDDETDINLSHWWGMENRETGGIVISGARHAIGYGSAAPIVYFVGVQ